MKTESPLRMSYATYTLLESLLQKEEQRLWQDYLTALRFIPSAAIKRKGLTPVSAARKVYDVETAKLQAMREELRAAAASTYKDHPNPQMRKFWNV
jgi:hypothetical protein